MVHYSLTNLTIQIPEGATQHGNDHILCVHGPPWKDALTIITFFATNYIAHAATIKSTPGEGWAMSFSSIFLALMFPMSGLLRALNAIARLARFGGSELHNACRAGALCMVVRGPEWVPKEQQTFRATILHKGPMSEAQDQPKQEDNQQFLSLDADYVTYLPSYAREDSSAWVFFDTIGSRAYVDTTLTRIHGRHILPDGYRFAIVPRNTALFPVEFTAKDSVESSVDVSSSYSLAKALASLIQALAAFNTLLGHRHDLIQKWGYASFHLTVIPYLVMTVVNFLANSLAADYPCLYVVESAIMAEARHRGGVFGGVVATTVYSGTPPVTSKQELSAWEGLKEIHINIAAQIVGLLGDPGASPVMMMEALTTLQKRLKRQPREHDSRLSNVWVTRNVSTEHEPYLTMTTSTCKAFQTLPNVLGHSTGLRHGVSARFIQYRQSVEEASKLFDEGLTPFTKGVHLPLIRLTFSYNLLPIQNSYRAIGLFGEFLRTFSSKKHELLQDLPKDSPIAARLRVWSKAYKFAMEETYNAKSAEAFQRPVIYIPACPSFRRKDEHATSFHGGLAKILHMKHLATFGAWWPDPGHSRSAKSRGNAGRAMLFELILGCAILGLVIVVIGWLSNWFDPGRSTTEEKVIMLLWICEGTIGLLLPLFSVKELLMVFLLLPFCALFRNTVTLAGSPTLYVALLLVPLCIFVAPVWGFVLVGRMLTEWGTCVVLY